MVVVLVHFHFVLIHRKLSMSFLCRLASEGMIFCTRRGSFVSTAEKLHPAFAAYDAREKWEVTSVQRSQAVCWGLEEDSETDSDGEENLDEEAEDLLKCLSESQQIGAFERA